MSFHPLASVRVFFASRFSLRDNSLWRLMQLLTTMRRRILLANIALTLASTLSAAALVSLYPLFSATLQVNEPVAGVGARAVPASSQSEALSPDARTASTQVLPTIDGGGKSSKAHLGHQITEYMERWAWFRAARDVYERRAHEFKTWMGASAKRFIVIDILFILLLYCCAGGLQFLGNFLMSTVSTGVSIELMRRLYSTILRQEMEFFDHRSTGSLLNSCFREVFQIQTMIPMLASRRVMLPVTMLIYFCALLIISAKLSLLLLTLLPIVVVPTMLVTRQLKKSLQGELHQESGALDVMTQGIHGIQAIKAFGAERLEAEQLEPTIRDYIQSTRRRRLAQSFIGPFVDLLNILVLMIVLILSLFVFPELLRTEQGRLFAFMFALTRFYKPMSAMLSMNVSMQRARMVARHVFQMLDRQPAIADAPDAGAFPADWDALQFDNVDLVYTIPRRRGKMLDRLALKGVGFTVRRGEIVALVGPNGAGKSSIVKLICRLYEPTAGRILFGDTPVQRIRLDDLREQVCLITQHPILFNRPVAENITFGLEGIDQARIEAAARAVRAHDFIMRLPQGYETLVGESGKLLSGGERQKIVLARAFVRNPSLLIFDEPTAGLDRESVAEMIDLIGDLRRRGITIVWITHEREHLANADRILELTPERTVVEVMPLHPA